MMRFILGLAIWLVSGILLGRKSWEANRPNIVGDMRVIGSIGILGGVLAAKGNLFKVIASALGSLLVSVTMVSYGALRYKKEYLSGE